jgi:Tol biopolymer transport system component
MSHRQSFSSPGRPKRYSSALVLGLALIASAACGADGGDDDEGDAPGTAGSAGSSGKAGTGSDGGKAGAGGTAGASGVSATAGAAASAGAGGDGQESGGMSNDGGDDGRAGRGGQGGVSAETCGGELAPPLERWTAYVIETDLGQTTLFAAKSGALSAAVPLLEAESRITNLTWSPNGRFLAFVLDQGAYSSTLHVVDFSAEEPSGVIDVATDANETPGSPRWSPDSTRLLYAEPSFTSELRVVDFAASAPGATAVFRNCPQGAYSDLPCLGSFVQPLRLDWSPTGNDLAGVFISQFFTDFSTGSAADLFVLRPESEVGGKLASPFVPSFDAARHGVTPVSLVWSPDGARVAYTGSFEDTGSVSEAYVFALSRAAAAPIKLHPDLGEPRRGVRAGIQWASATTIVFASDGSSAEAHELLSLDVSDPNIETAPAPETLLTADGGSILEFALSPDRSSVLVLREAPASDAATLTVFPYREVPLSEPREVSWTVAPVAGGFATSARWSADSKLLAFAADGAANLKIAGRSADGSSCVAASLEVESLAETWHWLADESSVVLLDAEGIRRLHAGSASGELLSPPLQPNASIIGWAVQPRGTPE